MRLRHAVFAMLAIAVSAGLVQAQPVAMPPPHDPNNFPTVYRIDEGWGKLPNGRKWGGISAVDIDNDGKSVWVFDRCESIDGGCATSTLPPVIQLGPDGQVVRSWGSGQFRYPHGIFVDAKNNIWTAEGKANDGRSAQIVRKWTRDGKLLMTLGTLGVRGRSTSLFDGVSDVLVAPDGNIFVADGHDATTNARIMKFDANGKFIKTWGKLGSGPGEFSSPHGLAMDRQGRLYVADRTNNRIQIFDQEGKFLAEWRQFGRPSGLFIKGDMIYVADSQSNPTVHPGINPGFKHGIRWGKISDGKVLGFIPWSEYNTIETVAVDAQDNIYAGFTNVPNFRRFVKD